MSTLFVMTDFPYDRNISIHLKSGLHEFPFALRLGFHQLLKEISVLLKMPRFVYQLVVTFSICFFVSKYQGILQQTF